MKPNQYRQAHANPFVRCVDLLVCIHGTQTPESSEVGDLLAQLHSASKDLSQGERDLLQSLSSCLITATQPTTQPSTQAARKATVKPINQGNGEDRPFIALFLLFGALLVGYLFLFDLIAPFG